MTRLSSYSYSFVLAAEPEDTFELFSRPERLNSLTPSWFDLRPSAPVPAAIVPGMVIPYRLRWRGLPMRWVSRIEELRPPVLLTYKQLRGPYRLFVHEHHFSEDAGGTRVVDRVTFKAPGGWPVERWLVQPDLERIFRHRAEAAQRILGDPPAAKAPAQAPPALVGTGAFAPLTSAESSAMEPATDRRSLLGSSSRVA